MTPLVSCIVTAFDSERYIRDALASVHGQRYRPIEVIVADGGSRDGTRDLVRRDFPEVALVELDDAPPPVTRNAGAGAAQGDLLCFIDADDLWLPGKIERQVAQFTGDPSLDACVTHVRNVWIDGLENEAQRLAGSTRSQAMPGYATTTLMVRRERFREIGGLRDDLWYADSVDWFLRARRDGLNIRLLDDVLTLRRIHPRGMSRRHFRRSAEEFIDVIRAVRRSRHEPPGSETAAEE